MLIDAINEHLTEIEFAWAPHRCLIWQIENVSESQNYTTLGAQTTIELCGTMMGHRVFRHRIFYCNYDAVVELPHDHKGKRVGTNGLQWGTDVDAKTGEAVEPNMWGVYSRRNNDRGTSAEWHASLGALPGTYSPHGIVNALPLSYGRLLSAQMIAHVLNPSSHRSRPAASIIRYIFRSPKKRSIRRPLYF